MARFVFPFEALLEQRKAVERQHQIRVAQIERERLGLEQNIRACQSEIAGYKEDLRSLLVGSDAEGRTTGPVNTRTVRLQANASLHVQARTQHLAIKLAGLYKRLEEARSELRGAMAARRGVEVLKERRYERWLADQTRRENAQLDEIGTIRAGRKVQMPGLD